MTTIGIPNLPCGNFSSVIKMVEKCGGKARLVSDPTELTSCSKIVLAGVGAFDAGMSGIVDHGWKEALDEVALQQHKPLLGICLGMQLLCMGSEEGVRPGLGWINAEVRRFRFEGGERVKVPHMGWNTVRVMKENPLIPNTETEQRYYFVHSYHAVCSNISDVLATTHHGYDLTAAVSRDNIMGVQFHPEKSHRFGMALLKNFIDLPC
jgi:glutamine amidotransferase